MPPRRFILAIYVEPRTPSSGGKHIRKPALGNVNLRDRRYPGDGFPMSIYFCDTWSPGRPRPGKAYPQARQSDAEPSSCHSERSEESAVLTPAKNDAP